MNKPFDSGKITATEQNSYQKKKYSEAGDKENY